MKGVCICGEKQRKDWTLCYASFGNQKEEDPAMVTVKGQPVSWERNQELMMSWWPGSGGWPKEWLIMTSATETSDRKRTENYQPDNWQEYHPELWK